MPVQQSIKAEYPNKRPRVETKTIQITKFANASQIKAAIQTESPDALKEALTSLRNQLAPKPNEISVPPQDDRLSVVKRWIESSPGAEELFKVWDGAHPRQSSVLALVISNLSIILTLLSSHYTDHAHGHTIMKTLLNPARLRYLNSYIGGSHNELIIVTLKLYNAMSDFAGGRDKKSVLEGFGWEIKSLPKLLNMRRKTNGSRDRTDPLLRPDIRTLYILLLLSFISRDSNTRTKGGFLEQHREAFLAIFKGISQDHHSLARKILEVCWAGIWSDNKVKRTLKVGLFNEITIGHLLKLYDRVESDGEDDDQIPANLIHHFLLAICTRPGTGICFKDRGWYPREADPDDLRAEDDDESKRKLGRTYNKILANVLKTLKVNEDSRQQELATKILSACPELVAGYWSAAALTLEPRLSSKWITNISFFGNIISLPIPNSSLYLPNATSHILNPTPPPLSTIIENILPSVGTKNNFSKGLRSSSGLVQHCTALALSKCLLKFQCVLEEFRTIAKALEEDDGDGQWTKRCRDVEKEVRRRVPEFQVVVAFGQQKPQTAVSKQSVENQAPALVNHTKNALLAESAQRLLGLYQRCLPAVVAEARFDVGKLLQTFVGSGNGADGEDQDDKVEEEPSAAERLQRVQKLHVLRLLEDSDQFVLGGKIGTLSQTSLFILSKALVSSTIPAIQAGLFNLLRHSLSQSILFQEDPDEPELWLRAVPLDRSLITPTTSQDSPLLNFSGESDAVIAFLDDCVQRCLKTPHRYVESLQSLATSSTSLDSRPSESLDQYPSPLLMTLLEQLAAKVNNKSLSSTQLIGIVSFIRKVIFYLSSKMNDLVLLRVYAKRLEDVISEDYIVEFVPVVIFCVRRETEILKKSLAFEMPRVDRADEMVVNDPAVEAWLENMESQPLPATKASKAAASHSIIDNIRMLQAPLSTGTLKRIFTLALAMDTPAVASLVQHLIPGQADGYLGFSAISSSSLIASQIPFHWLFLHTDRTQITNEKSLLTLKNAIFAHSPTLINLQRVICTIMHATTASMQDDEVLRALVLLLAHVLRTSRAILSSAEFDGLKGAVFIHAKVMKDILFVPLSERKRNAISELLDGCLDPASPSDRKLVVNISNHWFNAVRGELEHLPGDSIAVTCIWIKYLELSQQFLLLDTLQDNNGLFTHSDSTFQLVNATLDAISVLALSESQTEAIMVERLPQLVSLRLILPKSVLLEKVLAVTIEASLPLGLDGLRLVSDTSSPFDSASPLYRIVELSRKRWAQRLTLSPNSDLRIDIQQFLAQDDITEWTARITSALSYREPAARDSVLQWIVSEDCQQMDTRMLIPIVHALVDVPSATVVRVPSRDEDIWIPILSRLFAIVADVNFATNVRSQSQHCAFGILSMTGSQPSRLLAVLRKEIESASTNSVTPEVLALGTQLCEKYGWDASTLVDIGIQACITHLADGDDSTESERIMQATNTLVKATRATKAHLVETLLSVTIRNHLPNAGAIHLAVSCLHSCQLKPVVVNRHLQSVIQHPHFFKICSGVSANDSGPRDTLVEFLHALFELHPHNTCQISHIEPLVRIYRGTVSTSDLQILSIFQLFESHRKLSVTRLLLRWSATPNATSTTALGALQSLDPILVLRSYLQFPRWRRIADQASVKVDGHDSELYDPVFIMILFSQMLAEEPPSSVFAWLELFRTNVISLFIRALAAKDGSIRELALCQIVALWKQLDTRAADIQEKFQVQHILLLLKDLLPEPASLSLEPAQYPIRLPTYTALLLSHALRGVFYPSNFIFPLTARFLLQRPSLDISDVPMLYKLLYSSSDEHWKKERAWLVSFLADGMVGSEDWNVLKRRHTWNLLASLFQSESELEGGGSVGALRLGILQVLANLTSNARAATSLVLKSGLLPWIEVQLLNGSSSAEDLAWIKIFENIVVIVDSEKIEAATNGDWRVIICRSLCHILDGKRSLACENLPHAIPLILRLASLKGPELNDLPRLLDLAVKCLERLEIRIEFPTKGYSMDIIASSSKYTPPTPPHRAASLLERSPLHLTSSSPKMLALWGSCVEMLWHSCMLLKERADTWDALMPRLLVWRSIRGPSQGKVDIAERAREMLVESIQYV